MRFMRKTAAAFTAAALSLAMISTAYAASVTSVPGTDAHDVTGTYQAGSAADTVYKVDIKWGSMAFVYTAGDAGSWNPETHQFTGGGSGSWAPQDTQNGAKITVTNHSNAAVNATLTYAGETGYEGINGSFVEDSGTVNDGVLALATAVNTEVSNAPSATATLSLTGALSESASSAKIGGVTVALSVPTE